VTPPRGTGALHQCRDNGRLSRRVPVAIWATLIRPDTHESTMGRPRPIAPAAGLAAESVARGARREAAPHALKPCVVDSRRSRRRLPPTNVNGQSMFRYSLACAPMAFAAMAALVAQSRRTTATPAATAVDTAQYAQLTFRHIGPEGYRVTSVTGVSGDPMTR
jgi:hypothetical protein